MLPNWVLAAMMGWVSQVSGIPPAPMPQVFIAHRVATEFGSLFGGSLHLVKDNGSVAGTRPGRMYFTAEMDWSHPNDIQQCVVAHELTHLLQMHRMEVEHDMHFGRGHRYRCTGDMEKEAYAVENTCLADRGVDFWKATGMTRNEYRNIIACEN